MQYDEDAGDGHHEAAAVPPPLPPPLPGTVPSTPPQRHRIEFTGRAGEYFGIWIVNLVLTVLTLGIYSAWAKVRTERYLYGNTRFAGSPFEYLAKPTTILKGRLVAYAVVIGLGLCAHFEFWAVYFPLFVAVLVLMPWLIQRTLRFRARYSAWRGLRFRFVDGVYEAYVNYFFRPMLLPFTLYLTLPWIRMNQQDYMVAGHRFGGRRFRFQGDLGSYFVPFAICIGLGIAAYAAMLASAVGGVALGHATGLIVTGEKEPSGTAMAVILLPMLPAYLAFLMIPVFLRTRYVNLMWSGTQLDAHRFESTLRARDVIWIYLSNGLAIVASLGMLVPWAMVRLARYRAEHFAVLVQGGLDEFVAETAVAEGAAGAELVDALDFDLDIGL